MSANRTVTKEAADGIGTPHARSTVSSAELVVIPEADRGKFWTFHADAGSGSAVAVYIRFGDATAAAVIADRSALDGSGNLTADVNVPHLSLAANERRRVLLDPAWTHFSHISSATTGCLRFAASEGV